MSHLLQASSNGYYHWLIWPMSDRAIEDQRLLQLIRAFCDASRGVNSAPRIIQGRPFIIASNKLERTFTINVPDRASATDIADVRTWQNGLYLAVIADLYSRKVVGGSIKPTLARDIVLDALVMAVRRRKPCQSVLIHSANGPQYIRRKRSGLSEPSMSALSRTNIGKWRLR